VNGVQRREYHVAGALLAESTTDGDRRVERRKSLPILCLEKYDDYVSKNAGIIFAWTDNKAKF
jgi:hypothetical protein